MADYYTLASFDVKFNTEQRDFALNVIELLEDPEVDIKKRYGSKNTKNYSKEALRVARKFISQNPHYYEFPHCGFNAVEEDSGIWFHSDESIDLESVSTFIQLILRHFKLNQYVAFEFSHSCSKPRLDAYGGGAIFITKNKISWLSTYSWIDKQVNAFNKRNSVSN